MAEESIAEVTVAVADAGAGLASNATEVFIPFWRSDEGRSRRADDHGGVGLGLSISQAIIEAHSGRIEAGNGEHGGAVLTFALPERPPRTS
jgi:signal transduction histidine kinase